MNDCKVCGDSISKTYPPPDLMNDNEASEHLCLKCQIWACMTAIQLRVLLNQRLEARN